MIPKTMFEWRQDQTCLDAGRRLSQNEDFKAVLRVLEGYALMQRGAPDGASEIDVARKMGESTGHSHIIGFLYTMDVLFKAPRGEQIEAKFEK